MEKQTKDLPLNSRKIYKWITLTICMILARRMNRRRFCNSIREETANHNFESQGGCINIPVARWPTNAKVVPKMCAESTVRYFFEKVKIQNYFNTLLADSLFPSMKDKFSVSDRNDGATDFNHSSLLRKFSPAQFYTFFPR